MIPVAMETISQMLKHCITRNTEHNRLPCATAAGLRAGSDWQLCIMSPGPVDPFTKYQESK